MMFKGSPGYGPGEIDRRTQALGGSNNAFTTHDATAYYFRLGNGSWEEALEMESDRMAALTLDPAEVEAERQVILEEIALYESDPWASLEDEVRKQLFGRHPYGIPVLGTRAGVEALGTEELGAFFQLLYRPGNAVLVVAGPLEGQGGRKAATIFEGIPGREPESLASGAAPVSISTPAGLVRLERRRGETPRLLLAFPAPPAIHEDHAALSLLLAMLAWGRSSRLQSLLVEERAWCSWLATGLSETREAGAVSLSLEVSPAGNCEQVEETLIQILGSLPDSPFSHEELARARRLLLSDWIQVHERVHEQAMLTALAASLFDLQWPRRIWERLLSVTEDEVRRVADVYLNTSRSSVLAWSLPERGYSP
jgi:zinc protease